MEREQLTYLLQNVAQDDLARLQQRIEDQARVELIQKPVSQILLVPVRDPINEGSFISGEVLVTTAIVRIDGTNGWAMVMDDNQDLAITVAIMDGAFAADICREEVVELAMSGRRNVEEEHARLNAQVQTTKVNFDLL